LQNYYFFEFYAPQPPIILLFPAQKMAFCDFSGLFSHQQSTRQTHEKHFCKKIAPKICQFQKWYYLCIRNSGH